LAEVEGSYRRRHGGRLCDAVEQKTGDVATVRRPCWPAAEIVSLEWPGHGERRALHVAVLAAIRDGPPADGKRRDARVGSAAPRRTKRTALLSSVAMTKSSPSSIRRLRRRGLDQAAPAYEINRELEEAMWSGDQERVIACWRRIHVGPAASSGWLDGAAPGGGDAP